tara:strand:- start:133 stop:564 length:432 start_codon:yes stop_codon:yes gene_type:complete
MIKFKQKKIFIGIIAGFILSFGTVALADIVNDSWNIGDGWLWFKEVSSGEVRGNVSIPLDGENIANKDFVEAAVFGEGGSGGIVCTSNQTSWGPGDQDSSAINAPYFWCCMPNLDGTDMICIHGNGYTPQRKYENGSYTTINP